MIEEHQHLISKYCKDIKKNRRLNIIEDGFLPEEGITVPFMPRSESSSSCFCDLAGCDVGNLAVHEIQQRI